MPVLNTQPRESKTRDEDDGSLVDVVNVWETIQGEGPLNGTPAVFVRLAGCNLTCQLCDTDYTSNREKVGMYSLVSRVQAIRPNGLVVLTGGEPLRQNIAPLVSELMQCGYKVQIETNGTFHRELPFDMTLRPRFKKLVIVCSPKAPAVHARLQPFIEALKYVVASDNVSEHDGLPNKVLGSPYAIARPWEGFRGDIFLQPEDHKDPYINQMNINAAVASCMKFGYRLCLQTHKIVGLD